MTTPVRERWAGTILILISTICYGISNTTIRVLTDYEIPNDWILFYKELIGFAIILPWLTLRFFQGRYHHTSKRLILFVALAAILCELIGARLHVLGFAVIGLLVAVPLVQSSTLLGTAVFGRIFLGDPISRKRITAIAILISSVILLSIGKEFTATQGETEAEAVQHNMGLFLLVAAGTVIAGIAYSIYIVMIRFAIRKYWHDENSVWMSFQFSQWAGYDYPKRTSVSDWKHYAPFPVTLMMSIVLGVGIITFGLCLFFSQGMVGFTDAPEAAWRLVPISGVANMVGFFFQIQGLRMTTAVQASLIAVSQMLVLSFIGFFFFDEPINLLVVLGLSLTAVGVVMSARPEK